MRDFIHTEQPDLFAANAQDGWGYAVFGKVVEGMEVVDDIGHRPTGSGGPFDRNVPIQPLTIERMEVLSE